MDLNINHAWCKQQQRADSEGSRLFDMNWLDLSQVYPTWDIHEHFLNNRNDNHFHSFIKDPRWFELNPKTLTDQYDNLLLGFNFFRILKVKRIAILALNNLYVIFQDLFGNQCDKFDSSLNYKLSNLCDDPHRLEIKTSNFLDSLLKNRKIFQIPLRSD